MPAVSHLDLGNIQMRLGGEGGYGEYLGGPVGCKRVIQSRFPVFDRG